MLHKIKIAVAFICIMVLQMLFKRDWSFMEIILLAIVALSSMPIVLKALLMVVILIAAFVMDALQDIATKAFKGE
jgi:hypothetical protein